VITVRWRPSRRAVLGAIGLVAGVAGAPAVIRADAAGGRIAAAFRAWLESLPPEQRSQALFPFDHRERFDWHYTPRRRDGVALRDMAMRPKALALAAVTSALSEAGSQKVVDIMRLEAVLRQIETFGFNRDPENYLVTVFGAPGDTGRWGWRFEGHHLSINMTFRDGVLAGATPMFLGANPAVVPTGHLQGLEVMASEIGAARRLLDSLDAGQRDTARIADRPFGDIVAGPGREDSLAIPEGLATGAITTAQTDALGTLIEHYAGTLAPELAQMELRRVRGAGLEGMRFAWAGAFEPGRPHYFRVHGPAVLIEYDNSRNDANHIHSVWHDPGNPFGRDVLGAHYRAGHHHA